MHLLKETLEAYEKALAEMPRDSVELAVDFLRERNMIRGICSYMLRVHGEEEREIAKTQWLTYGDPFIYWGSCPDDCHTVDKVGQSLQYRIDKMRELLTASTVTA